MTYNPFDDCSYFRLSKFEFMSARGALRVEIARLESDQRFALELHRQRLADQLEMELGFCRSALLRLELAMQQAEDDWMLPDDERCTPGAGLTRLTDRDINTARLASVGLVIQYCADHGNLDPAPPPSRELVEAVRKGVADLDPKGKC